MPTNTLAHQQYYSPVDAAKLWIQEGGPPAYAPAAGILTIGESGGDPGNVNPNGGATGLYQIHPGGEHYKDPRVNTRAAIVKFNRAKRAGGTGFEPWLASKSAWGDKFDPHTGVLTAAGKKAFETGATGGGGGNFLDKLGFGGGFGGVSPPSITNPLDAIVKPLEDIGKFFSGAYQLLLTPEGWRRISKVLIGTILLLWGVNQLAKAMAGVNPAGAARQGTTQFVTKGQGQKAKLARAKRSEAIARER